MVIAVNELRRAGVVQFLAAAATAANFAYLGASWITLSADFAPLTRSEERRVGKECPV